MEKKLLNILVSVLVNMCFLCVGFYCKPTILLLGVVVHWPLILLGINVLFVVLILLYILGKKIVQALWKKFIKELKRELNIV